MPKYKWTSPHHWITEKAQDDWTPDELLAAFNTLVAKVDADTIQDLFQEDMENDGYFEDLDASDADASAEDEEVDE